MTLPVDIEVRIVCALCGWSSIVWLPLGRGPLDVECQNCRRLLALPADIHGWRDPNAAAKHGIPTLRAHPR